MRYRTDLGLNDCFNYVDIFWLVFFFIILRLIFEILWRFALNDNTNFRNFNNNWWTRYIGRQNRNANLGGDTAFNNIINGNNNIEWFTEWQNWVRWRTLVFAIITEAIIGFLIALLYLLWQEYVDDDRDLCVGQEWVLQRGLVRNSIALLISAIALVIAQWYYVNYNFGGGGRIIIRNRIVENNRRRGDLVGIAT